MSIRKADSGDAPKLRSLVVDLSRFYLRDPDATPPDWLASSLSEVDFVGRLAGDDYYNYVYELNSELVAYISIKRPNHVYHLFVAASHQGKGIARLLWEHATKQLAVREALIYSEPVKYRGHNLPRRHETDDLRLAGFRPQEET
ncbi:MAG: GNAT family N-acetyltransferase, partial [Rhodocyclaceae bacterium]